MNTQEKIEQLLRAAPQPPAPDSLLDRLQKHITVRESETRPSALRRFFAPSGERISQRRVAVAAVLTVAALLSLSYGATKLIRRFITISQLPAVEADFPSRGALSPDGRYFAGTTWDGELVVIDTSTGEQRKLGTAFGGPLVWSADGSEIAVSKHSEDKEQRGLVAVSLKTGDTRTLARYLTSFEDWSPDGKLILFVRRKPDTSAFEVVLENLENGERTILAEDSGVWAYPGFSPKGDWVSYLTKESGRAVLNLKKTDGTSHVTYSDFSGDIGRPLWSPDGNHIIFTGAQQGVNRQYKDLWMLRIQGGQFGGAPFPVVPDVEQTEFFNWSQNGQLAYRTSFALGGLFTLPVDLQTGKSVGAPRQLVRRGGLESFCWSPDGKEIAVRELDGVNLISARSGQKIHNISLHSIEGNIEYAGRGMSWSPDGKWIALPGWEKGEKSGIFLTTPDGKDVRLLVSLGGAGINCDPTWSPDSETIAYGFKNDIYVVKIGDGVPQRVTPPSENQRSKSSNRPVFAPDGKSVAYLAGFEGRFGERIMTTTIDGQETRELFSLKDKERGINIFDFSPDGRHVVFTPGNNEIWCAPTGGGEPFKIADISNVGNKAWAWMPKWSPKGDAITFIVTCEQYQYWVMENFLPTAEAGGR